MAWQVSQLSYTTIKCSMMCAGLKEMMPLEYLQPFDAQELEWVIAGTPEINMDDWKANTVYWGGKSSLLN